MPDSTAQASFLSLLIRGVALLPRHNRVGRETLVLFCVRGMQKASATRLAVPTASPAEKTCHSCYPLSSRGGRIPLLLSSKPEARNVALGASCLALTGRGGPPKQKQKTDLPTLKLRGRAARSGSKKKLLVRTVEDERTPCLCTCLVGVILGGVRAPRAAGCRGTEGRWSGAYCNSCVTGSSRRSLGPRNMQHPSQVRKWEGEKREVEGLKKN